MRVSGLEVGGDTHVVSSSSRLSAMLVDVDVGLCSQTCLEIL